VAKAATVIAKTSSQLNITSVYNLTI